MNGKVVSGLTIKEVSETYDISADTLRYYERIGMIPEVTRTAGGIRDYQESDLGWVELVICMRKDTSTCIWKYARFWLKG